jgi:hypothetical protein
MLASAGAWILWLSAPCFQAVPQGSGANQHAFVNVVAGGYWSGSTYELDPTYAYLVDLSVTDVSSDNTIVRISKSRPSR